MNTAESIMMRNLAEKLAEMTSLVKIKYGNLEPDVWEAILEAEALVEQHAGKNEKPE